MELSSQFICELGTYHQETKVTYCSWLGQKRSHTSFSGTLTSRRSQQHGGPTRLVCGRHSLKKTLDLGGRNDGHHRAQHGWSSSGLAPRLGWSFVNSAGTTSHIARHAAGTTARTGPRSSVFPSKKGERPVLGFMAFHHSVQLRRVD